MIGTLYISALASAATAVLGTYVAALAAKGYRSHGSTTMGALAVGIVAITVVPFVVTYVLAPAVGLSDAGAILGVMLAHTAGLLAIYRTFG